MSRLNATFAPLRRDALLGVGPSPRLRFLDVIGRLRGRRCRAGRIGEALGQATERASPFAVQPYLKVAIRLLSTACIPSLQSNRNTISGGPSWQIRTSIGIRSLSW